MGGCLDPFLVVGVTALGRKLLVLGPVQLRERTRHDVPILELHRIGERLEQPSSDDLEAFLRAGRPPGRFDPPDDVPKPVERLPAARAADLDVVGLGVKRAGRIRRRQADHEQAVRGEPRRFGQRLREGELRLEGAGRRVALVVQTAARRPPARRSGARVPAENPQRSSTPQVPSDTSPLAASSPRPRG